jgi:hypothetical protein
VQAWLGELKKHEEKRTGSRFHLLAASDTALRLERRNASSVLAVIKTKSPAPSAGLLIDPSGIF